MIKAIVGVPGAGKGVYGTMQAEEELRNTDRPIITCLALRVAPWTRRLTKRRSRREIGMAAYLLDKYGDDLDVWSRVHVLTDESSVSSTCGV